MLLPHQLISSFCTRFSHYHLLFGGLGIAKMSQARTICYVKHMYIGWNCLVWPLQQQTQGDSLAHGVLWWAWGKEPQPRRVAGLPQASCPAIQDEKPWGYVVVSATPAGVFPGAETPAPPFQHRQCEMGDLHWRPWWLLRKPTGICGSFVLNPSKGTKGGCITEALKMLF